MAGSKPSTELVVAGSESAFLALRMPDQEITDLIRTNVGSRSLDAQSLDRVKIPSGGSTTWEIPTLDGEEANKELTGVIIHWATRRVMWVNSSPDGSPPDCASHDGFTGYGEPGGACQGCPLNVFGSDDSDKPGKKCRELRQLFILQEDGILPLVVNATPGSLKNVDAYFNRLLRAGIPSTAVVTTLTLEKAKAQGGEDYAKIVPKAGLRLDPDARARIEHLADQLRPAFERAAREVDQEDIEGHAAEA